MSHVAHHKKVTYKQLQRLSWTPGLVGGTCQAVRSRLPTRGVPGSHLSWWGPGVLRPSSAYMKADMSQQVCARMCVCFYCVDPDCDKQRQRQLMPATQELPQNSQGRQLPGGQLLRLLAHPPPPRVSPEYLTSATSWQRQRRQIRWHTGLPTRETHAGFWLFSQHDDREGDPGRGPFCFLMSRKNEMDEAAPVSTETCLHPDQTVTPQGGYVLWAVRVRNSTQTSEAANQNLYTLGWQTVFPWGRTIGPNYHHQHLCSVHLLIITFKKYKEIYYYLLVYCYLYRMILLLLIRSCICTYFQIIFRKTSIDPQKTAKTLCFLSCFLGWFHMFGRRVKPKRLPGRPRGWNKKPGWGCLSLTWKW